VAGTTRADRAWEWRCGVPIFAPGLGDFILRKILPIGGHNGFVMYIWLERGGFQY